jgi:hypothetical protein
VLLLSQVTLVAAKRTHIHRRLGVGGGVLAAFMIVVGTITAIQAARRGVTPPGGPPPLVFLLIPLSDILMFSILVAAGFHLSSSERDPQETDACCDEKPRTACTHLASVCELSHS